MVLDMLLDGFTTNTYRTLCQEGKLDCWMWPLGVFLVLPTILATLVSFTCGWTRRRDMGYCEKILSGPLYSLAAPFAVGTPGMRRRRRRIRLPSISFLRCCARPCPRSAV